MPPEMMAPLVNVGAVGAIVLWFMLRTEGILKDLVGGFDRLSRTINLFLLAQEAVPEYFKKRAQDLLEETEAAEISRRPKK